MEPGRDAMPKGRPSVADRVPAPVLFLGSGFTQYCGAALAIGLFAVIPAASVAWWRLAVSAVVLLAWRRPWRQRWSRRELGAAALFGVVLATMNVVFYVAIDYLPLGTAVAIEFLGPVVVAGVTGRGWRDRLGIALAAVGVVALAGVQLEGGFSRDVVIGLVAIGAVAPVITDAGRAAAVVGIAVLSSVIPYAIEQVVLRRVSAARFAILLALLPVTAAVIGAIFLAQVPAPIEIIGTILVCAAIALSARGAGDSVAPAAVPDTIAREPGDGP